MMMRPPNLKQFIRHAHFDKRSSFHGPFEGMADKLLQVLKQGGHGVPSPLDDLMA